ncbi:hypothetical protein FOXG_03153 [Fusarium oxysporum f. sp. lycopersici 4287]|uniref:Uncharacterized protein n=2 Tax=Fusarium oxysporum TaxID=5507 RepID=A0A0J9UJI0_FUSO4|nr:hypothetical protein FOXG_03153 [Fusarium oxysporum f. sp. lycopersici 4287]KNA99017.1 hypothetical protein FOXG_03153 [Fusarium oxysporum f. sp. lycopersici 4287]
MSSFSNNHIVTSGDDVTVPCFHSTAGFVKQLVSSYWPHNADALDLIALYLQDVLIRWPYKPRLSPILSSVRERVRVRQGSRIGAISDQSDGTDRARLLSFRYSRSLIKCNYYPS